MGAATELVLGAVGQPNQGCDIGRQIDVDGEAAGLVLPPGDPNWPVAGLQ